MLEAIFQEGILSLTLAGLTQWDYGQKLTIKGLTVSSALEVHFSNNAEKEAIVMSATKSGSDIITEIPNVLLEKDKDITAWVYTDDGQSGETIRTIVLKVTPRIKPADYISENNAGKVIDYVAMAEEYANSAQESAKSAQDNAEQVQANTDIVKDLLANVPDFDSYEKLAEHNKLLYDGLYVKGETYSGIASNKGIKLHSVVGKTSQKTTNGYQLFDSSKIATKTQGGATVTNNGDGSFTVSGSGNLTREFLDYFIFDNATSKQLFKAGTVSINNGVETSPYMYMRFDNNAGTIGELRLGFSSFTLTDENINSDGFKVIIGFYSASNIPIKTGTVKPMVYQDGDGTWEPYTGGEPAPNLDYAMPIENVEISEITSHGRNLIPYPYYCGGIGVKNTQSGINFEILPDKSFKLSGTATSNCYINLARIDFGGDEFSVSHYIGLVGNTDDNIVMSYNANNKITSIYISPNATVDTIVYPMISKGKQVPEWEAPTGYNTVETSLTLAQDDIYKNGITRARKQVTFDGSSDENWINVSVNDQSLIRFSIIIEDMKLNPSGKCNRFEWAITPTTQSTKEVIGGNPAENRLHVIIKRSRLETEDISGFKKWLSTHNTVVEYELATPTTEELKVPTIPSYNPYTNILTDNTLPTDIEWELLANSDNSLYQEELEKRIQALEAQILGL